MTVDQLIAAAREVLGEFTLSNEYSSAGNVANALLSKEGNLHGDLY